MFRKCSFSFTLPRENATHVRSRAHAGAADSPLCLSCPCGAGCGPGYRSKVTYSPWPKGPCNFSRNLVSEVGLSVLFQVNGAQTLPGHAGRWVWEGMGTHSLGVPLQRGLGFSLPTPEVPQGHQCALPRPRTC